MKTLKTLLTLSLLFAFLFSCPQVWADRGGFSPSGYEVFESGQKAIIAWNGTSEMLVLSSDVKSSQESKVIEFLPLPSNPSVSKGKTYSFNVIVDLVGSYLYYTGFPSRGFTSSQTQGVRKEGGVEVTFHEKIGVHDLTVVRAEDAQELISWIENFLSDIEIEYEDLPSDLEDSFSAYLEEKINFFAVDVIDANSTTKSVEPLVYEFESSKLYYPLRISTLFSGETDISLFTITSKELNEESILEAGFQKIAQFNVKLETITKIDPNMTKLFSHNPYLYFFKYEGSLKNLNSDIAAGFSSILIAANIAVAIFSLGTALTLLLLLFPRKRMDRILHGNR